MNNFNNSYYGNQTWVPKYNNGYMLYNNDYTMHFVNKNTVIDDPNYKIIENANNFNDTPTNSVNYNYSRKVFNDQKVVLVPVTDEIFQKELNKKYY